jgi:hypothetical protein
MYTGSITASNVKRHNAAKQLARIHLRCGQRTFCLAERPIEKAWRHKASVRAMEKKTASMRGKLKELSSDSKVPMEITTTVAMRRTAYRSERGRDVLAASLPRRFTTETRRRANTAWLIRLHAYSSNLPAWTVE